MATQRAEKLPAVDPAPAAAVKRSREQLEADLEAERKADIARLETERKAADRTLFEKSVGSLRFASHEKPMRLRRVTFTSGIVFDDQKPSSALVDLVNRNHEGTVLLFTGDLVHIVRTDPAKSFVVPVTSVSQMFPLLED